MEGEEEWFESFVDGLPCPKCRNHFEEFVKDNPPNFSSRVAFFEWGWAAHNHVNLRTGKKIIPLGDALETHRFKLDPV
jgi:hypothetical protein